MTPCLTVFTILTTCFHKENRAIYLPSPSPRLQPGRKPYRCAFAGDPLAGSMTLECAMTLPLFLMACVILLLLVSMPARYAEKMLDLSNKARQTAMYSASADGMGIEWIDLPSFVTQEIPFIPSPPLRVPVRARCRVWTGADASVFGEAGGISGDPLVYVTDYESVYHTHADCTHLDLAVIKTDTDHVGSLRNVDGERYRKCDGFPKGYTGPVYVTEKGDRYYPSTDYAGLTRHVHLKSLSDAEGLPLCERCAARDA